MYANYANKRIMRIYKYFALILVNSQMRLQTNKSATNFTNKKKGADSLN